MKTIFFALIIIWQFISPREAICQDYQFDATLIIKGTKDVYRYSNLSEKSEITQREEELKYQETITSSAYVPLKLEYSSDMPMLNQRWEYYKPLDFNLSNFHAEYTDYRYSYYNYPKTGNGNLSRHTIKGQSISPEIDGKEYMKQSNVIVMFDRKTNKAVQVAVGGYSVKYDCNIDDNFVCKTWSKDEGEKDCSTYDQKTEEENYSIQPVEDLIPNPDVSPEKIEEATKEYFKSLGVPLPAETEIPEDADQEFEIAPEFLVKAGDGVNYLSGEGKKIIDKSDGDSISKEELTFSWQMTRNKKNE
jgi:hypothetical protein